ncbi:MAG: CPBP family intramembrane metalloprotease [Deltaproteobacteria bacterium]|nr:CPBP family intramembrane metalloprotease [Deltaproteobacteria bacterium]MBW2180454.1 CPBP family intramembrane metalloprotease [Deltaproteobacteria bacterium]
MKKNSPSLRPIIITLSLAFVLWFITFSIPVGNFGIKISISASFLAICAFRMKEANELPMKFNFKTIIIGLVSAVILYAIFWIGQTVSHVIFSFSKSQIDNIYALGKGSSMGAIVLLLFFITGPAEEIYWRGFVQKRLSNRFGGWQGWLIAAAIYAGVHICTLNFMLVGAAGVAGLFWGWLYWRLDNLAPVMISHAVWSAGIFAVFPVA